MLRVYGSRISYYTGKLEAYLRYRRIPYELLPSTPHRRRILAGAGALQMPVVELEDGRWLSDSTPILAWFEAQQEGPSIYPEDPAVGFAALLIEDFADEWLWRPAMHYRWSFLQDRQYAGGLLADEQAQHISWPRFVKRFMITRRQLGGFVRGDGVTDSTRAHVEQSYSNALERLEAILSTRRFMLGDQPTIADFGLMGPMLRHFGQDPTPQEIMRQRAPGVYAWVARIWNTQARESGTQIIPRIDEPVAALLAEACETHLVQLRENAVAHAAGKTRYDQIVQGCRYTQVPCSRYRVWCLEELRRAWGALDAGAHETLRGLLPEAEAGVLWDEKELAASHYDPERRAPLARGLNVFGDGIPPH